MEALRCRVVDSAVKGGMMPVQGPSDIICLLKPFMEKYGYRYDHDNWILVKNGKNPVDQDVDIRRKG